MSFIVRGDPPPPPGANDDNIVFFSKYRKLYRPEVRRFVIACLKNGDHPESIDNDVLMLFGGYLIAGQ